MVKQDCQYLSLECTQVNSVRQMLLTTQCYWLHSYKTLDQVLQGKARQGEHLGISAYMMTYTELGRNNPSTRHEQQRKEPHGYILHGL